MSKYRRKTANAKERDRMKTVNEAFEKLKSVVPVDALLQQQQSTSLLLTKGTDDDFASPSSDTAEGDENLGAGSLLLGLINPLKSTKVSTLRCAIAYINSLQKLIDDSEKGILDPSFYENDEKEKEDKNSSIEKLLGKQICFNGDNNNNRDNHDDQNGHKTNPALSVFHSLVRASQLVFHHCQRPSQVVVPGHHHDYRHDCPVSKFTVTNDKSTSKSYFISFSEAILRASLVFLSKPSSSTWST